MIYNGFNPEWFKPINNEYIIDWFFIIKIEPQKGTGQFLRTGKIKAKVPYIDIVNLSKHADLEAGVYIINPRRHFIAGEHKGMKWFGKILCWVGVDEVGNSEWFEYVNGVKGKGISTPPKDLIKYFGKSDGDYLYKGSNSKIPNNSYI